MTRKDYNALANDIADAFDMIERKPQLTGRDALALVATNIADTLQADNPRFDRKRFLEACKG